MTICVLVGIPGSGKSTIGKELAIKMNVKFVDTDREIEIKVGKSVGEIFIEDGEAAFRELEKAVVLESLKQEKTVVSLGGGSVLDQEVRLELLNHRTYWLDTSINNALKRTGSNTNRPLLLDSPRSTLKRLLEERSGFYAEVAAKKILTESKSIKLITDEIYSDLAEVNQI